MIGALLAFVGATLFFTNLGKPSNAPFTFNPLEAINAIGFTLSFGLGVNTTVALVLGFAVITIITVAGFYIGRYLYTKITD